MNSYDHDRYSERSSLHDVRHHAPPQFPRAFSSRESIMRTDANCCFGRAFSIDRLRQPPSSRRRTSAAKRLRRSAFVFPPACQPKLRSSEGWWSQTGSNRRPPACKAGALPAELWPRKSVSLLTGLSAEALVGLGRFELPTSRLSSARSNQLSYKPVIPCEDHPLGPAASSPTASAGDDAGTRNATEHGAGLVHEERET